jgi:DNA-directed RNA polymerase specialized sigma24 family protein
LLAFRAASGKNDVADTRSSAVGPEQHAIDHDELQRFDRAILVLDARSREALLLRLEGDLEYSEIARQCDFASADGCSTARPGAARPLWSRRRRAPTRPCSSEARPRTLVQP